MLESLIKDRIDGIIALDTIAKKASLRPDESGILSKIIVEKIIAHALETHIDLDKYNNDYI